MSAHRGEPPKAQAVAMQPETRLLQVRVLGMCFVIEFAILDKI